MPGTLDNKHTMVSALYQFIRPKADHLLLTDTIVGGNLQVKGSLNAPSFKATSLELDVSNSNTVLNFTLDDASSNQVIFLDLSATGLNGIANYADPSGQILLPKATEALIGKKYRIVFGRDLSGLTTDASNIDISCNGTDVFSSGSYVVAHNAEGDASGANGSILKRTDGTKSFYRMTTQTGGNSAYGKGTTFDIECLAKKTWLLNGNAYRGDSFVQNEVGDASGVTTDATTGFL